MDDRQTEARRALDRIPLNVGFARTALEVSGAPLWSDRPHDPRAFHVVHPSGMSFVWGPAVDEAFPEVVDRLRHGTTGEWLQIEPRWTGLDWDGALGAAPHDPARPPTTETSPARHTRVAFTFDAVRYAARRPALLPPVGWRTRPATTADFDRPGSVVPAAYWPDAATFLAAGGGTVVERDGTTGAMAFASFRGADDLELGIETDPAFRRQGLAAAAASALLGTVLAAGRTPVWSCREGNVGSYRLAVALGFTPATRTPYYHLPAVAPEADARR